MPVLAPLRDLIAKLFAREPKEDTWVLPANAVTRAIESGRELGSYDSSIPVYRAPAPPVKVDPALLDTLPPLPEAPARHVVVADDVPLPAAATLAPSEQPLEATEPKKKRWWRRAA